MISNENKQFLILLVEGHNKHVAEMIRQKDDCSKVVPDSVFRYTEMFMNKVVQIIEGMSK